MLDPHYTPTVAVKPCWSCRAGLMERDRFCRSCGVAQPFTSGAIGEASAIVAHSQPSAYTTSALQPISIAFDDADSCRPVSGPLVKAVVAAVAGTSSARPHSRFVMSAIMALIAVPIWLMIVLLSPLDAYAAARAVSRGL